MYVVVFITTKNQREAKKIANGLLKEKLAACVNIVDAIQSMYWWQGKIEQSSEALMIVKTKKSLFKALEQTVKQLHSYSVPEIVALDIGPGNEDYLDWIKTSVRP